MSVVNKLLDTFTLYASFGVRDSNAQELDGARFNKFCRESGILTHPLHSGSADIVFAKVKPKGLRKINFEGFLEALRLLSLEKYPTSSETEAVKMLFQQVLDSQGPQVSGTTAVTDGIYAKLTDTRLYSGIHAYRFDEHGQGRGLDGRDSVPVGSGTRPLGISHTGTPGIGRRLDLSDITRPEMARGGTLLESASAAKAAAHGYSSPPARPQTAAARSPASPPVTTATADYLASSFGSSLSLSHHQQQRPMTASVDHPSSPYASGGHPADSGAPVPSGLKKDLRSLYLSFALFGSHEDAVRKGVETGEADMDNVHFAKFCRETGVIGGSVTPASVDIAFSRFKKKGGRTINFDRFMGALSYLACEKYPTIDPEEAYTRLVDHVCVADGPVAKATSPRTNGNIFDRLTDARTYTGAHRFRFDEDQRRAAATSKATLGVGDGEVIHGLEYIVRPNLR